MMANYTSNYIKNYIFQILATGIGLLSLFVVVPYISGDKTLYGIYSICVSLTIFVNYADLGFLTAGQKYAAESYAKGDYDEERRYVGFTLFILLSFVSLVLLCFVPIAIKPSIMISELDERSANVASSLIWIIIIFSPVLAIKRVLFLAYAVRIEHYKYQIVTFSANVVKILSVFYFFKFQSYNLVGYYLFIHIVELISVIILMGYADRKYNYALKLFFKTIRFAKDLFDNVKSLAGASLLNSVAWILFYELDLIILAKIATPEVVAIYSVAFTTLTLFRNYLAIIYSAFSPRYNHYVGEGNMQGLSTFFKNNIIILAPFVLFPIIVYCFGCHSFILSWVGKEYTESIMLSIILVAGNLLAFINYPSSALLTALNKVGAIVVASLFLPLIFYGGILTCYYLLGVVSFAVFKTIALIISSVYSFYVSVRALRVPVMNLLKKLLINYFFPVLACIILSFLLIDYYPAQHTMKSLICDVLIMGSVIVLSFIISVIFSKELSIRAKDVFCQLMKKGKDGEKSI